MIPYGDSRCGNCQVEQENGKNCPCLCHTTNMNQSKHKLTYEMPMNLPHKRFRFLIRWVNRLKGEKFETI